MPMRQCAVPPALLTLSSMDAESVQPNPIPLPLGQYPAYALYSENCDCPCIKASHSTPPQTSSITPTVPRAANQYHPPPHQRCSLRMLRRSQSRVLTPATQDSITRSGTPSNHKQLGLRARSTEERGAGSSARF